MPDHPHADAGALAATLDDLYVAMRGGRVRVARRVGTLSAAQLAVLDACDEAEERTVGELAAAAGIRSPTATRMLRRLEQAGLVARRRGIADERRVLVRLSDRGREQRDAARTHLRDAQARRLDAEFSAQERAQLAALARRLVVLIEGAGADSGRALAEATVAP